MTQYVYGKNVVRGLLEDKKTIHEILVLDHFKDKDLEQQILNRSLKVKKVTRHKLDQLCDGGNHQGIAALIDDYKTYEIDEILHAVPTGKQPLLVMLDGLEDPHNLGAILRTADCAGVDGVIIGKHRSVSLTPTVAKVSTGAIDTVKVCAVTNLVQTIRYLKEQGFWVAGADFENSVDYRQADYKVPLLLVIGSEGFGLSSLVKKNCDYAIRLPMAGSITSLNASVACGILLYQIYADRHPL